MLRRKEEKPFWFSSLGQMIQFVIIKFRRTFKNYFGQFVSILKNEKRVTILVAFHFMKRRLKIVTSLSAVLLISIHEKKFWDANFFEGN